MTSGARCCSKRLVEDLRSKVLGLLPVAHTPCDERVHALEAALVEIGEARGVGLRRFYEKPFVGFLPLSLQPTLRGDAIPIR